MWLTVMAAKTVVIPQELQLIATGILTMASPNKVSPSDCVNVGQQEMEIRVYLEPRRIR